LSEQSYVFLITIEKVHKHHFEKFGIRNRSNIPLIIIVGIVGIIFVGFSLYCQQLMMAICLKIFFAVPF